VKKRFLLFIIVLLLMPAFAFANTEEAVFEARVISIEVSRALDGSDAVQQNALLEGLTGEWKGKKMVSDGISELEVLHNIQVKPGDKVSVNYLKNVIGEERFYIIDYVRSLPMFWLALLFAVLIIVVGRMKGLKALISLALSFVVILYFMIPGILAGYNPLLISIACSFLILFLAIYITWGWTRQAHIAFVSIALSLFIAGLISLFFTIATRLTGMASEDITFLAGNGAYNINFQGLLLAGIIIGILGVLDDVVISQVSTVQQLHEANRDLSSGALFSRAMKVGVDHISSMTNTLFLAYVGVSLPLLLLFKSDTTLFQSFGQIINNELVATEIVRTFAGSVGLVLAVPISTFIAAKYWSASKKKNEKKKELEKKIEKKAKRKIVKNKK